MPINWEYWPFAVLAGVMGLWIIGLVLWEWGTRCWKWRKYPIPGYFGQVYGSRERRS